MIGANPEIEQARITKFFAGPYNRLIHKGRYFFVGLLALVGIGAAIIASDIGPLTQQEEYLPKTDPLMVLQKDVEDNFKPMGAFTSAANVKGSIFVNLNWGVKDLDRSKVGAWAADEIGDLIWDDELDVYSPESQQALLNFCTELKDSNKYVLDSDVSCWLLEMDNFVRADTASSVNKLQIPIQDKAKFEEYLYRFIQETEVGGDYVKGQLIGFDVTTGKVKFMRVIAKSIG